MKCFQLHITPSAKSTAGTRSIGFLAEERPERRVGAFPWVRAFGGARALQRRGHTGSISSLRKFRSQIIIDAPEHLHAIQKQGQAATYESGKKGAARHHDEMFGNADMFQ